MALWRAAFHPPAKASARWVRATAASLRSPKMKQKIVAAMFSRLFLKTKNKNLRYSIFCMPSAIIYNLWIFTPWTVLNVNSILWYRNLGYRRWWACLILRLNYIMKKFHHRKSAYGVSFTRVAKLDVSKLVNKNPYVALWSNFYVLTDKTRKRNLVAVEPGEMIFVPGVCR